MTFRESSARDANSRKSRGRPHRAPQGYPVAVPFRSYLFCYCASAYGYLFPGMQTIQSGAADDIQTILGREALFKVVLPDLAERSESDTSEPAGFASRRDDAEGFGTADNRSAESPEVTKRWCARGCITTTHTPSATKEVRTRRSRNRDAVEGTKPRPQRRSRRRRPTSTVHEDEEAIRCAPPNTLVALKIPRSGGEL